MKILFHLNSMGRGGAEHVVSILSKKFIEAGHEVILTNQWVSENEYELDKNVKRIMVGLTDADDNKNRIQKAFARLFRLRNCIKSEKPDLVISFCAKANFRSAFSMFGINTPLIVSVRNNPEGDYAGHKVATWYMERKAAGCVFQTPDARNYFSKKLQEKSKIIFNPIDEKYIGLNLPDKINRRKEIVNVGRISKQKNQMLLLKAFDQVRTEFPDYTLKIYGDIQDKAVYEKMKDYVAEHKMDNNVIFAGTVNNLQEKIVDSKMFVLSSDFEGMPNSLIEAMALGLPSISTDCPCGGSGMLIENGVSGWLVPVKDEDALAQKMKDLIQDSEKAEKIGSNARKILDKVLPDKICEEWEDFIKQVI